jgi:protein required for attachment to host cells
MRRTCIAIIDATRARLFTFDRVDEVGGIRETFSERTDLMNPVRRKTPAQLFSDSRPGTNRTGGLQYGFDDHRDAHMDELDIEFARAIVTAIEQTIRDTRATRVIVCASPRMLGMLRAADLGHMGLTIDELARDYVKLTLPQIHEQLVAHGLLPAPPPRPGLTREA